MPRPSEPPIGLRLSSAAKTVGRAFDDALTAVGGSRPTWLILLSLKMKRLGTQKALAEAVGIEGATLTHHLDIMEGAGLITRRRDPNNRRVQVVELTRQGDAAFLKMRSAATEFDRRLRAGFSETELAQLRKLLDRLAANVSEQVKDADA